MRRALSLLGVVSLFLVPGVGCLGERGPQGIPGDAGPPGPGGDGGSACLQPGGLRAAVAVSSPLNGAFFLVGDRPVVTITFTNPCGQTVPPDALGSTADFFVVGPRSPLQTVTAYKLLNFTPRPFGAQSLKPLADGGTPNSNMTVEADGTVVYTLSAISNELPGTYTASVWATGPDPLNQMFALQDFQIGTATVEPLASGPADGSTCASCHKNIAPGGKMNMAHAAPAPPRSPVGDYALDSLPIGGCKSCHNNAGYSPNHLLRKTHGVHRGEHQLAPGAAHPEYGFGFDESLAAFGNVGFPVMPTGGTPGVVLPASVAMEKSCTTCHVNDAWMNKPSRAACGSCHDNLFFSGALLPDGGVDATAPSAVFTPPTVLGFPPSSTGCTTDASCSALSTIATCNTTTKNCELTTHARQTDDAQCATCHGPTNGISPIAGRHGISPFNPPISLEGFTFKNVTVTGGSGPGGSFQVNDSLTVKFQLFDNTGASVADLVTNTAAWSGTFLVAGPTSNPQRVFGSGNGGLNMRTGLGYDPASQTYTYVAGPWPANALIPLNNANAGTPGPTANPPGNYTVWFYWARTTSGVRDAVDAQMPVAFGVNQKPTGRQVVTQAACGSCHGITESGFPRLALHGGQRKNGETCSTCHTQSAQDRGTDFPAFGISCTVDTDCPGNAGGWETCQQNGAQKSCKVTVDPTPGVVVDYQQLVHNIHFARLREGFKEQGNLGLPPSIPAGTLNYLGFNNSLADFQEILAPVDVRSCTNCHRDTNTSCSDSSSCGYGQTCGAAGKCVNVAWQNPTARACITCHDADDSAAHAAQMTTASGVESCPVCHGPGGIVEVAAVHNITSPFVPPYAREP